MSNSSWYRRSVWHFKGTREYTKSGYETASHNFVEKDLDVDCSGKHYMITGANSGIGLATALEIAKRGGELHLVCRNAKSMKEARSHIITTTGNDRISQHQVNLAKPREVKRWADEFLKTYNKLDVLINNAGCMIHERILDDDGIENNFAVNTLAVHIIVTSLIPLIEKSTDGRVIIVSSGVMLTVKLDFEDLNCEKMKPFIGAVAYSQNKRQQVVMNFSYAQIFPKVHFSCMHPGWVDTPALKNSMPEFYNTTKDNLKTPFQGSDTIVWLAVSAAARKQSSGLFFQDRAPTVTHLPMAWTKSPYHTEKQFMQKLDELVEKFSNIEDYFTISNVGSDIIASDSFLGQTKKGDVEDEEINPLAINISTVLQDSADVVSTQTSLDHPSRLSSIASNSDDDAIINAVENILYNDDSTKINRLGSSSSSTTKEYYHQEMSQSELEKRQSELYLSAEKITNLQIDLSKTKMMTEMLVEGSTSDKRKEAAIDDLLNDAFQTVNLEETE